MAATTVWEESVVKTTALEKVHGSACVTKSNNLYQQIVGN